MPKLKIYGIARTRAFRVLWMAKELGLDYEHLPIEIGPAGARKSDYLAINPNGRLPSIEDDGFVMWESQAINLYLAKKHSQGRLYPRTLEGEARAWQWSLWAANEVERAVNIWSLHAIRLPPQDRKPEILADAINILTPPFKVLNGVLGRQGHLAGPDFTVADLNVAAVISRAAAMEFSATPHLEKWLRACLDRPAAREARALREAADASSSSEVTRMIAARNRL